MKRFARLYAELDESNRTSEKIAALERYFRDAPARDAAWGLHFLSGRRLKRAIKSSVLWRCALDASGLPEWLLSECHAAVGDFSETLALVMPAHLEQPDGNGADQSSAGSDLPLHELVERFILPLPACDERAAEALLRRAWSRLSVRERFVYHKLLSTNFRVGVQRRMVARALASVAGIDVAVMEHRLLGDYSPAAESFRAILSAAGPRDDAARPYPFCLASQLEAPPADATDARPWQVEWKWDGIRAQLIRRNGHVVVWSRGEEVITDQFPELGAVAAALTRDAVLDGEVLAWNESPTGGGPLPFSVLQTRLNRKRVSKGLFARTDLVFMAYDLLEIAGKDIRPCPLHERRTLLEQIASDAGDAPLRRSPIVPCRTWSDVARARDRATDVGAEGVMLKPLDSAYHVGRIRGDLLGDPAAAGWWKWKIDPLTLDAVLIAAQLGSGKRASLYTDYTFGLWHEGNLLPFAKAYSGLTDDEISRVDSFVRKNTLRKLGPVCVVKPTLVFEIAFEAIRESNRHKSGIAVRFPRIARWRSDKQAEDADTVETARSLLHLRYGSMS
ncbi:MAG: ATP-dependent DNA ligase, partial [Phycisphaerales bacterium]